MVSLIIWEMSNEGLPTMKYRCEVVVNVPRGKFIELFDNPANMPKWMSGLQTFDTISGTPGQPGAKSRLVFLMGKKTFEMIETITTRNLPYEFSGTYDAKGVHNIVINHFHDGGNATRWVLDTEFAFKGFMKFMAMLMPGMFKKESMKHMMNFKKFAESQ
jgi:hypothetical protein